MVNVTFGYLYDETLEELLQPDYGTPNEGGYKRFWITTFPTDDGSGWMYVWGDYDSFHPYGGWLYVNFYNEIYKAYVTLFAGFSTEDVELAEAIGLEAIIAQRYPRTQHIIQSFRFLPPLAPPTPWQ